RASLRRYATTPTTSPPCWRWSRPAKESRSYRNSPRRDHRRTSGSFRCRRDGGPASGTGGAPPPIPPWPRRWRRSAHRRAATSAEERVTSRAVMPEAPFLAATRASYDAVAAEYAEVVGVDLDARPLDRALLTVFAEQVRAGGNRPVAD